MSGEGTTTTPPRKVAAAAVAEGRGVLTRRQLLVVCIAALAFAWPWLPEFTVTVATYIGLYALVAVGLVMLSGVAGMTSFGQAAFVGTGALGGMAALIMFNIGVAAKLTAESIDAVDPGPIEAVEAAGGSRIQRAFTAVVPQVAPNYFSYCFYVFELNLRASLVIGVVGGGGLAFGGQQAVHQEAAAGERHPPLEVLGILDLLVLGGLGDDLQVDQEGQHVVLLGRRVHLRQAGAEFLFSEGYIALADLNAVDLGEHGIVLGPNRQAGGQNRGQATRRGQCGQAEAQAGFRFRERGGHAKSLS